MGIAKLTFDWNDLDGDGLVAPYDRIPLSTNGIRRRDYDPDNFDPDNPSSFISPNQYDKDLKSPRTDELILGAEYEIAPDFTLGMNLTYREKDRVGPP